ncbi:MAG: DEAD/DEAH box helicase, partial [Erysipelotrichaceae bacterium]|nr:DEAD/DEAH box helicase [Erysipelotrichaceae bacterium]
MHFHELPLQESLLRATDELGYEEATEIQQACIPAILKGKDVIGKSQTGTGKTAAFGLPLLQLCHIQQGKKLPQMLVLLPTRELAMQVGEDLRKYLKYTEGLRTVIVYGGEPIVNQINELKKGADIIVGTPGRILDHIERSTIRLHQCDKLVLDEADEMLDMGFREDIDLIIEELPSERQSVMFSATMPKEILELKERYLKDPVFLQAKTQHETAQTISQYAYFCKQAQKKEVLMQLITLKRPELSMVFCNTRKMVDELTGDLVAKGYPAACIHGDMKQEQRTSVLERFKNHKIHVLVCTDVAARGLDIANLDIVFNYDFPQENEYYVHRIGRTGRAGKEGVSITLLNHRQHFLLNQVQKMTKAEIIVKPLPTQAEIAQIRTEQLYGDMLDLMQGSPTATMHTILDRLIQAGYSERDVACMLMQQYFDDTLIESIDPNAEDVREFELPEQTTIYLNLGTRQGI